MQIVNIFIKEPCTGWGKYNWEEASVKPYENLNELLEDFSNHGQYDFERFKILRSWQEKIVGGCSVYHVEMKTEHQINTPDVNQAEYEAIITILEE